MERQIKEIYKKAEASLQNPEMKKRWQGGVGIVVMVVFVLSSVLFNETVQAVNRAAGNYGYYSGTYGYNADSTSSDAPPSPVTDLSCSGTAGGTSATCTWTAPTTTVDATAISTGGGSISTYLIHYNTGSQSGCSGGSSTTSTSASVTLSSLTTGTTYFVAVCARDNNLNDSAAATTSFTIATAGGGQVGGGAAVSVSPTVAAVPTGEITPLAGGLAAPQAIVAAVTSLQGLSGAQLANTGSVATALGVDLAAVTAKVSEATTEVKKLRAQVAGLKQLGVLESPLATVLAALGVKNPELSTARGKEGFVRDLGVVLGGAVLNAASRDARKAEIVTELAASVALGAPIDRRTVDKEFKALGTVLLKAEAFVVKQGIFQKLFGRLPKTDAEWNLVKVIAYRGRVVTRNLALERKAIALVQGKLKVNLVRLDKSKAKADKLKAASLWAIVRATAASGLLK